MDELTALIGEIQRLLRGNDLTDSPERRALAERYGACCAAFNAAAAECQGMLRRNMVAEARQYAETREPPLARQVQLLHFPERPEFMELFRMYGWPAAPEPQIDVVRELSQNATAMEGLAPLLNAYRQLARNGTVAEKVAVVRQLAKKDQRQKAQWLELLRPLEEARFNELADKAKKAILAKDYPTLEAVHAELSSPDWVRQLPAAVLNKIKGIVDARRQEEFNARAAAAAEKVNDAYSALDYERLGAALGEWDDFMEARDPRFAPEEAIAGQVAEAREYHRQQTAEREEEAKFQNLSAELQRLLEEGAPLEEIETPATAIRMLGREVPEALEERYEELRAEAEEIRARRHRLAILGIVAAAVAVIAVALGVVYWRMRNAQEQEWRAQIAAAIDDRKPAAGALTLLEKVQKDFPDIWNLPSLQALVEKARAQKEKEEKRQAAFKELADTLDGRLKDQESYLAHRGETDADMERAAAMLVKEVDAADMERLAAMQARLRLRQEEFRAAQDERYAAAIAALDAVLDKARRAREAKRPPEEIRQALASAKEPAATLRQLEKDVSPALAEEKGAPVLIRLAASEKSLAEYQKDWDANAAAREEERRRKEAQEQRQRKAREEVAAATRLSALRARYAEHLAFLPGAEAEREQTLARLAAAEKRAAALGEFTAADRAEAQKIQAGQKEALEKLRADLEKRLQTLKPCHPVILRLPDGTLCDLYYRDGAKGKRRGSGLCVGWEFAAITDPDFNTQVAYVGQNRDNSGNGTDSYTVEVLDHSQKKWKSVTKDAILVYPASLRPLFGPDWNAMERDRALPKDKEAPHRQFLEQTLKDLRHPAGTLGETLAKPLRRLAEGDDALPMNPVWRLFLLRAFLKAAGTDFAAFAKMANQVWDGMPADFDLYRSFLPPHQDYQARARKALAKIAEELPSVPRRDDFRLALLGDLPLMAPAGFLLDGEFHSFAATGSGFRQLWGYPDGLDTRPRYWGERPAGGKAALTHLAPAQGLHVVFTPTNWHAPLKDKFAKWREKAKKDHFPVKEIPWPASWPEETDTPTQEDAK